MGITEIVTLTKTNNKFLRSKFNKVFKQETNDTDLNRYSPHSHLNDSDDSNDLSEAEDYDSDLSGDGNAPHRPRGEFTEMKEQMYQDKLADLKHQLTKLNNGTLTEWQKKLNKLEKVYKERIRYTEVVRDLEVEMVEQDFIREKKSAFREFEDQKVYLKDQLIAELEEKQKLIEAERHNMELTGDSMEMKPITTRKLRRRANEPSASAEGTGTYGTGEKRRKPMQLSSLTYLLEDSDVIDDLKIINKNKAFSMNKTHSQSSSTGSTGGSSPNYRDTRIEDGKLFYEKRWFRRGQSVQVEPKSGEKFPALISAIGTEAIWVRRTSDSSKIRIYLTQLTKGKYVLKRRTV